MGLLVPLALPDPRYGFWPAVLVSVVLALVKRVSSRLPWVTVSLPLGLLVSTAHGYYWTTSQLPSDCWRQPVVVSLEVTDFPRTQRTDEFIRQRFRGRIENTATPCAPRGLVSFSYFSETPALSLGDQIEVEAVFRPPTSQWSPDMIPDQARHAAAGTRAVGRVVSVLARTAVAKGWAGWRASLGTGIDSAVESPLSRGVIRALVVGDGGAVSAELWQLFRAMGLTHVLVISGLHVGLVALGTWWLLGLPRRLCLIPGDQGSTRLQSIASGVAALAYAGLAGFTVPTQRALFMIVVVLLVGQLGWRTAPWRVLLLAVNLLLLINPLAALGSSFWMSAVATGLLLTLSQRNPLDTGRGNFPWPSSAVLSALWIQCCLVLLLLPLTAFWFGESSLLAIPSNLLLAPVLTLWSVPFALLGVVLLPLLPVVSAHCWQLAALPIEPLIALMAYLRETLSHWLVLHFDPSLWELALFAWVAIVLFKPHGLRRYVPITGLLFLLTFVLAGSRTPHSRLAVMDVGQGTSVLFQRGRHALIYDTGGGSSSGFLQADHVLMPYLRHEGISEIDTLVVSHADTDHSAGLEYLTATLSIRRHLGFGGEPCRTGMAWQWDDGTRFQLLNGTGQESDLRNDGSCVLLIEAEGQRILLAGDISLAREHSLVRYWREQLAADVLLIGHHGSATSSGHNWIKWVSPEFGVISRARANRFGHPDTGVVSRLTDHHIKVVDTALLGTWRWSESDGVVLTEGMRNTRSPYWLRFW